MNLRKRLSLGQRIRRDKITDIRELIEIEQRQWGPRMRHISSLGTPMAGLGFTGVVVPNTEPVVAPASVSSLAGAINVYQMQSTGTSTWMYAPPGNIRAPQSWRVWAGGTMSTAATTSTLLWTTRVGSSAASVTNPVMGSTAAMAPGSSTSNGATGASVTAAPWWYEAHLGIRTPGTAGTAVGMFNVDLPCQAPIANTATGLGGGFQFSFDMTAGMFWELNLTVSGSPTTGVQLQHFTIIAWD